MIELGEDFILTVKRIVRQTFSKLSVSRDTSENRKIISDAVMKAADAGCRSEQELAQAAEVAANRVELGPGLLRKK